MPAPTVAPARQRASPVCTAEAVYMDCLISVVVVHRDRDENCQPAIDRAFRRFADVEERCSRFDPTSELSRLSATFGTPVPVSPLLYQAISFACEVAAISRGAFDPTVGRTMERNGFSRCYRTGERYINLAADAAATFRDVLLDPAEHTVMLRRPLVLDLGAVAKGLAIDLAARELLEHEDFAIDAGGDLYLHGLNSEERPWPVGVVAPRDRGRFASFLEVSGMAVCTSGDYERPGPSGGHHLVRPSSGRAATAAVSATVAATSAMEADALATAAFVMGPRAGRSFLESRRIAGLIISATLEQLPTRDWPEQPHRLS